MCDAIVHLIGDKYVIRFEDRELNALRLTICKLKCLYKGYNAGGKSKTVLLNKASRQVLGVRAALIEDVGSGLTQGGAAAAAGPSRSPGSAVAAQISYQYISIHIVVFYLLVSRNSCSQRTVQEMEVIHMQLQ